jgi:hypothetical protein
MGVGSLTKNANTAPDENSGAGEVCTVIILKK